MKDLKVTDLLSTNPFTLSAEVLPSSSDEIEQLILAGCQFISVTDGALGASRESTLPAVKKVKAQTLCVPHITCRYQTGHQIAAQLQTYQSLGIRSLLALKGDPRQGQTETYSYAYQLVQQIKSDHPDICVGVAAYPDEPDREKRLTHFEIKVQAGAHFAITQIIQDADSYEKFLNETKAQIPVLAGTCLLKSKTQAQVLSRKLGFKISDKMLNKLPASDHENEKQFIDSFLQLSEDLKKAGAPGLHLFTTHDVKLSGHALQLLKFKESKLNF